MRLHLAWGRQTLEIDVLDRNLVETRRAPAAPPMTDLAAAMRQALEHPFHFPA